MMERNDALEQVRREQKLGEIKSILVVITSAMVLPLYFLFWLCDLIYAPELKWEFLALRSTIIPVAFIINFFTQRTHTLAGAYKIAFAYAATMGLPICFMVLMLKNPATAYYAGLNLVAIATLTFIPWTRNLFALASVAIFAPYYVIVLQLSQSVADYKAVAVNSFFIVSTVVISAVVRLFYERMRYRELSQQLDLNREIERRKQMELAVIRARDEAVSANEIKSSFLANMSHELRTPLNAIIGYSELLQDEAVDDGMENYVQDLQKIQSGGRHLLNLINDVLDISKIESGRMEISLDAIPITSIMKNVQNFAHPLAEKNRNGFTLRFNDIGVINTDQTKLQQILLNLISNACKFTHNGQVTLAVDKLQVSGQDWLRFEVSDTGIGMTPEQCNKIFQAFVQAESTITKQFGGTGLGLTISQRFSRMMGGDILVSSRPGHGSTFTVYLPRDMELNSQLSDEFRVPKDRRVSVKKIAVLDNDRVRRDSIEATLIQHCFDLTAAGVDADGVQFAKGAVPDVIVYNPMAGVEINRLWDSADEKTRLLDIPTVLVVTQANQRQGFAFAIHRVMDISEVQSQIDNIPLALTTTGRAKSILLLGKTLSGLQDTLKAQRWITASAANETFKCENVEQHGYDLVALEVASLLQTPQTQAIELMKTINGCDSKLILVVEEKHRADHGAGLYALLSSLMSKNSLVDVELNLLIAKLVKKSLRGTTNKFSKLQTTASNAETQLNQLST